jgi:hypothetical protein
MNEDRIAQIPFWVFLFVILPLYIVWRKRRRESSKGTKGHTEVPKKEPEQLSPQISEEGAAVTVIREIGGTLLILPIVLLSLTIPIAILYLLVKLVKAMWNA